MTKIFLSCTISVGLARSARRLYVFYIYIRSYVVHVPFTRALRANVGPAG